MQCEWVGPKRPCDRAARYLLREGPILVGHVCGDHTGRAMARYKRQHPGRLLAFTLEDMPPALPAPGGE